MNYIETGNAPMTFKKRIEVKMRGIQKVVIVRTKGNGLL